MLIENSFHNGEDYSNIQNIFFGDIDQYPRDTIVQW